MKDLIERCFDVTQPFYPDDEYYPDPIDMSDVISKFPGCYATNNSTICFVYEGKAFVVPYTREVVDTLIQNGYQHRFFYVPFSSPGCRAPSVGKDRWLKMRQDARIIYELYYEEDCIEWCNEHGIKEIAPDSMKRCLRIPKEGVLVHHPYFEKRESPILSETSFDCMVPDRLGSFCTNNGVVAFVYRDGHTYVTRGYWIVGLLEQAGFRRAHFEVPFSNSETIQDPAIAAEWQSICDAYNK